MSSEQEFVKKQQEINNVKNCPVCGSRNKRESVMRDFDLRIIEFLHENSITKRDSCISCVEKHVGYAMQLFKELLTLKDAPHGSVELNHLEIIGELRAATEESSQYEKLYYELLKSERDYRYEGIQPDWLSIANLIVEVKDNINNNIK